METQDQPLPLSKNIPKSNNNNKKNSYKEKPFVVSDDEIESEEERPQDSEPELESIPKKKGKQQRNNNKHEEIEIEDENENENEHEQDQEQEQESDNEEVNSENDNGNEVEVGEESEKSTESEGEGDSIGSHDSESENEDNSDNDDNSESENSESDENETDWDQDLSDKFKKSVIISTPIPTKRTISSTATPNIKPTPQRAPLPTPLSSKKDTNAKFYPGNIPKDCEGRSFVLKREELLTKAYNFINEQALDSSLPKASSENLNWNVRLRTSAGHCRQKRIGMIYSFQIELSTKVVDNTEKLLKTLSHEMAHAVVKRKKKKEKVCDLFFYVFLKRFGWLNEKMIIMDLISENGRIK